MQMWEEMYYEREEAREEGFEEGREEGIIAGREEGREEGITITTFKINTLNQKLLFDDRTADLKKSITDSAFQKQLMAEYGL